MAIQRGMHLRIHHIRQEQQDHVQLTKCCTCVEVLLVVVAAAVLVVVAVGL
jgi:hypothetical protein